MQNQFLHIRFPKIQFPLVSSVHHLPLAAHLSHRYKNLWLADQRTALTQRYHLVQQDHISVDTQHSSKLESKPVAELLVGVHLFGIEANCVMEYLHKPQPRIKEHLLSLRLPQPITVAVLPEYCFELPGKQIGRTAWENGTGLSIVRTATSL